MIGLMRILLIEDDRKTSDYIAKGLSEAGHGVAVVIADGSFNLPSDRAVLRKHLEASADLVFVTLRVSFAEALHRAQADPTRGRSQDPEFLSSHFSARRDVLAATPTTDIVIDTERTTTQAAAATIARFVGPVED